MMVRNIHYIERGTGASDRVIDRGSPLVYSSLCMSGRSLVRSVESIVATPQ